MFVCMTYVWMLYYTFTHCLSLDVVCTNVWVLYMFDIFVLACHSPLPVAIIFIGYLFWFEFVVISKLCCLFVIVLILLLTINSCTMCNVHEHWELWRLDATLNNNTFHSPSPSNVQINTTSLIHKHMHLNGNACNELRGQSCRWSARKNNKQLVVAKCRFVYVAIVL